MQDLLPAFIAEIIATRDIPTIRAVFCASKSAADITKEILASKLDYNRIGFSNGPEKCILNAYGDYNGEIQKITIIVKSDHVKLYHTFLGVKNKSYGFLNETFESRNAFAALKQDFFQIPICTERINRGNPQNVRDVLGNFDTQEILAYIMNVLAS